MIDTTRSLGLSFPFMQNGLAATQPIDAVVWYYSKKTDAFIALQNTKEKETHVATTLFVSGRAVGLGERLLKPREVVVIKMLIQNFVHNADATYGYLTEIHYRIEDQFTDVLPSDVPVNEAFGSIVTDFAGTNWRRDAPSGKPVGPSDWFDMIGGEHFMLPPYPIATAPCTPSLCNTAVQHWLQEWRVGSTSPGVGLRVQTDTLQKYTDHASHQNRVSPAP